MDRIKLAESAIKHLKDFIEVEKANKKIVTQTAKDDLENLSSLMIDIALNNIMEIKENN
jgi:hypothetical protein